MTVVGMTQLAMSQAPAPRPRSAIGGVLRRWPTLLALAGAALVLADVGDGTEVAFVLLVIGYTYLTVAVVGRRRATWPILALVTGVLLAMRQADLDGAGPVVLVVGLLTIAGLVAGSLRRPGLPWAQVPAAAVLASAALLATTVEPRVGGYVVAAGLLGHAAWDAYHWWTDRIVARSFAEWCAVFDLTVGVGLLVLL